MNRWVRHRNALLAASVLVASGALGFAVVGKTAIYYADTDGIAHALVWLIGLGMAGGLTELGMRLWRAVQLDGELATLPSSPTADTLSRLRPELRSFLEARLERSPLPSSPAAFTPYLVGLLVMLGLLGTFLGLFDTLRGARDALTASGDIEALRQGLAHPMAGLTRSFGSSAAGVSCSALLGLGLVCVRRVEMALVVRAHAYAAGPLQHLSPYQRQHEALIALAEQGRALPAAAEALAGVGEQLSALSSEWQKAHAQSAGEMREALQGAVRSASRDLERAATATADRLQAHIAPLLEGVIERAATAADSRFEALRKQLQADRAQRREAEQALRDDARKGLTELLDSSRAQLSEQRSELTTQLEEHRAHQQRQLTEQREQQQVQLAEQREQQQMQLKLLRESAEDFASTLQTQSSELVEALSAAGARDTEQVERSERALAGLEQAATAVGAHLSEQKAQVEALLAHTGEQVQALTAAAGEGLGETLQRLREAAEGMGERFAAQLADLERTQASGQQAAQSQLAESLGALRDSAEGLSERFAAQLADLERTQAAGQVAAQTQLTESLGALRQSAEGLNERFAAQLAELERTQTEGQTAAQSQLAESLGGLREVSTGLSETFAAQVQRLEQAQLEGLKALQQELAQQAAKSGEGLTQAGGTVSEAAALLTATTAELSAVAEMFAASVEGQREAARAWLENLGELEGAIEQSGRDAAADALGDQLAATQEVFARQLQFQKELFEQLRAMRPGGVAGTQEEQRASA